MRFGRLFLGVVRSQHTPWEFFGGKWQLEMIASEARFFAARFCSDLLRWMEREIRSDLVRDPVGSIVAIVSPAACIQRLAFSKSEGS